MTGRRAIVALSLLSALVFCAFAAPNAMALKGTTAFTCVNGGGSLDFAANDSHCKTHVTAKTGEYGHVAIEPGKATEVHVTNEKTASNTTEHTPATFSFTLNGNFTLISCTTVSSKSSLKNTTTADGQMEVEGAAAKVVYTGCKATKPFNTKTGKERCLVHSPGSPVGEIVAEATTTSYVVENALKEEEMGIENKSVGENFTELTFEKNGGELCSTITLPVTGTAIGTPTNNGPGLDGSGATLHYSSNEQKLSIGQWQAELSQTLTISMAGEPTENPISLTTTAS